MDSGPSLEFSDVGGVLQFKQKYYFSPLTFILTFNVIKNKLLIIIDISFSVMLFFLNVSGEPARIRFMQLNNVTSFNVNRVTVSNIYFNLS